MLFTSTRNEMCCLLLQEMECVVYFYKKWNVLFTSTINGMCCLLLQELKIKAEDRLEDQGHG